jgi:serine/threonine-protein kinase
MCVNCFAKKNGESVCRRCGYADGTPQMLPYLAPGTALADRYIVGKRKSANGEGVSYLAFDSETRAVVTVREFLPPTLCGRTAGDDRVIVSGGMELSYRDYLADFIDISKTVMRLREVPAIVHALEVFEQNGTAYTVYERTEGRPLSDIVRKAERLSWEEARPLFIPLLSAIMSAHAIGLVHFGITPDQIYLGRDGRLRLEGFGIPDARMAETELEAELSDGFSALEQYSLEGHTGKACDVYGISAVLFYCLTGIKPADAVTRAYDPRLNIPSRLAAEIPSHVLAAVSSGLKVSIEDRLRSVEALKSQLSLKSAIESKRSYNGILQNGFGTPASRNREPRQAPRGGSGGFNLDMLRTLSPAKAGLLSAGVATVVLGLIAVVIFSVIKDSLVGGDSRETSSPPRYVSTADFEDEMQMTLYEVPSFIGKKWEDISSSSKYDMFDLRIIDQSEFSDEYDEGEIMSQTVEKGQQVPDGTTIGLTVSMGSKTRKIPNIIGKSVADAEEILREAGLVLGAQEDSYSDDVKQGRIISISGSKVGAKLEYGSYVNVVVSKGPEPAVGVVE